MASISLPNISATELAILVDKKVLTVDEARKILKRVGII